MDTVGSADKASWLCFGNQSSTATSLLLPFSHGPQPSAEEGKVEQGGSESQHFGRETNKTFSWFDDCVPVLRFLCLPGSPWAEVAPLP